MHPQSSHRIIAASTRYASAPPPAPAARARTAPTTARATRTGAASLRFWRPVPRQACDAIFGEGAVPGVPLHIHEAAQVLIPASRFAVVDGQGDATLVQPGLVYVAPPLEPIAARSLDGNSCAMRVMLVAPQLLPAAATEQPRLVDELRLYTELRALFEAVRGPAASADNVSRLRGSLAQLMRLGVASAVTIPSRAARQLVGVARVRDHLRANPARSISLDELAVVAGLSKFYLLRSFSRACGVTPHAYQMQLRLARAWRLIAEGCSLTRATYDAGFADQSHLTRRFSAQFGVTPGRHARQLALPPGLPDEAAALAWSAAPTAA